MSGYFTSVKDEAWGESVDSSRRPHLGRWLALEHLSALQDDQFVTEESFLLGTPLKSYGMSGVENFWSSKPRLKCGRGPCCCKVRHTDMGA